MSRRLEHLATACLLPGFPGHTAPEWVRREIAAGLGGVVLFSRNVNDPEQVAGLTAELRSERSDLLIATDEEGGDVTRLELAEGSSYPGNHALGAVDDDALTERVGSALAGDLARVGINLDLAPVADVCTNEASPIIGVRSFGSDPERVARHVAALVRGLQNGGVAACAKHFPGHGDTEDDSHLELPTISGDRAVLEAALLPFRAAIEAGVRSIMTAHIRVIALDDEPVTISRRVLHGLLREELGFDGLLLTDALEMKALSETVGVEEGAVRALAAGADGLLLGHELGEAELESVRAALVGGVRAGRVPEERMAEAAARVGAALRGLPPADVSSRDDSVGLDAARLAISASGSVAVSGPALVVELSPEPTIAAGAAEHGLGDSLRRRAPNTVTVRLDEESGSGATSVLARYPERQLVVVVRDAHRHKWQQRTAESLRDAAHGDAILVETGLPVWKPPAARGRLVTHGHGRVNLEAAAELLLGTS